MQYIFLFVSVIFILYDLIVFFSLDMFTLIGFKHFWELSVTYYQELVIYFYEIPMLFAHYLIIAAYFRYAVLLQIVASEETEDNEKRFKRLRLIAWGIEAIYYALFIGYIILITVEISTILTL